MKHCEHHWATRECEVCENKEYDHLLKVVMTLIAVIVIFSFMVEPQIDVMLYG